MVPPRIEVCVWLACLGRLNTRAKLARLDIIPPSQDLCPLCNKCSETVDNLLVHCEFSCRVWNWRIYIWDHHWATPSSFIGIFRSWTLPCSQLFVKKVWWYVFYILVWSIWKERNEWIFNNSRSSVNMIRDLIIVNSSRMVD